MEDLTFEILAKQYGIAGILLGMIGYFLFRTVPKQIAPLLVKVIQDHLEGMSKAWQEHRERLDAIEARAEERHKDVLTASREGTRELIAYLQNTYQDTNTALQDVSDKLAEHDAHAVNLANKVGEVLRRGLPE